MSGSLGCDPQDQEVVFSTDCFGACLCHYLICMLSASTVILIEFPSEFFHYDNIQMCIHMQYGAVSLFLYSFSLFLFACGFAGV